MLSFGVFTVFDCTKSFLGGSYTGWNTVNPAGITAVVPFVNATRTKYSHILSTLTNWTQSQSTLVYPILEHTSRFLNPTREWG